MTAGLFGLKNSNRDFSKADAWGKNQFNSSFPAALSCYLHSKKLDANYISIIDNKFGIKSISLNDVFAINPLSSKNQSCKNLKTFCKCYFEHSDTHHIFSRSGKNLIIFSQTSLFPSHAKVSSTTQRLGKTANSPLIFSEMYKVILSSDFA